MTRFCTVAVLLSVVCLAGEALRADHASASSGAPISQSGADDRRGRDCDAR